MQLFRKDFFTFRRKTINKGVFHFVKPGQNVLGPSQLLKVLTAFCKRLFFLHLMFFFSKCSLYHFFKLIL